MLRGEDVMRTHVAAHYALLFRFGDRLLEFAQRRLFANLPDTPVADQKFVVAAAFVLASAGVKITRSIHQLAGVVLDETAMMLLRPLAEAWASMGWILGNSGEQVKRAKLYLAGEITERYHWSKHLVDEGITEGVPPEVVRDPGIVLEPLRQRLREEEGTDPGAVQRADQRLKEMVKRKHWAPVGTKEMFQATERFLDATSSSLGHAFGFKMVSGILHGQHPSLFALVSKDGNTISPNFLADDKYVGWALFFSDLLLASLFDLANRGLGLGVDVPIQEFMEQLLVLAKAPLKPLGDPPDML